MNYFVLTLNSDKWIKFNITLVFNGLLTFFTWLKYERALSVASSCSSKERLGTFLTDISSKVFLRFFVGFSCTSSLKVTLASCPMYLYILAEMIKTGNDTFWMTVKKTMMFSLPEVLRKSFKLGNDLVRYRAVETPWYRDHGHGMDIFV